MSTSVQGLNIGDRAEFSKVLSIEDVQGFSQITGDTQPLHLDPTYAAGTRFKAPIAHGMLVASLISTALGTQLVNDSVTVIYLSQQLQFRRPVYIGEEIRATVEVLSTDPERSRITLNTECSNLQGEAVIRGQAEVMLEPHNNAS